MNRYYGSNLGQFLTADPNEGSASPDKPQSWNWYGYVENDPVNQNDPTGPFKWNPTYGYKNWWLDCLRRGDCYQPTRGGGGRPTGGGGAATNPIATQPQNRDLLADAVALIRQICSNRSSSAFEDKGKGWALPGWRIETDDPLSSSTRLTTPTNTGTTGTSLRMHNTLLHELGHWYDSSNRSGGSDLHTPDSFPRFFGGDRKSRWNDWLTDQKCFGGSRVPRSRRSQPRSEVRDVPGNNSCDCSCYYFALGVVTGVQGKPDVSGKCVCEAAQIKSSRSIVVRGTGIFTRDEPILFHFGCPIANFASGPMPSVIVLEITSFASDNDREKFDSLKSYLDRGNYDQAVFQLVVRGKCRM
jgi:hypothetical protein